MMLSSVQNGHKFKQQSIHSYIYIIRFGCWLLTTIGPIPIWCFVFLLNLTRALFVCLYPKNSIEYMISNRIHHWLLCESKFQRQQILKLTPTLINWYAKTFCFLFWLKREKKFPSWVIDSILLLIFTTQTIICCCYISLTFNDKCNELNFKNDINTQKKNALRIICN